MRPQILEKIFIAEFTVSPFHGFLFAIHEQTDKQTKAKILDGFLRFVVCNAPGSEQVEPPRL
jgi:hypothetical protein